MKVATGGFAFVMNISSLDAASYELAPQCVLRRGSDEEIELIQETLARTNFEGIPGFHAVPWERERSGGGEWKKLPKQEWRYFGIGFEGSNSEVENLGLSSCLASTELEMGFTLLQIVPGARSMVWHPDRLFQTLKVVRYPPGFFRNVTRADIEEISSINSQLKLGDARIQNLVQQLLMLKGLPHDSPLRFLGYFALLESVLTQ
jgi:hypothetical protein